MLKKWNKIIVNQSYIYHQFDISNVLTTVWYSSNCFSSVGKCWQCRSIDCFKSVWTFYQCCSSNCLILSENVDNDVLATVSSLSGDIVSAVILGLSGDVIMSNDADRYASITVFDLTESGNFTTVAFYRMAIVNGTIFPVNYPVYVKFYPIQMRNSSYSNHSMW